MSVCDKKKFWEDFGTKRTFRPHIYRFPADFGHKPTNEISKLWKFGAQNSKNEHFIFSIVGKSYTLCQKIKKKVLVVELVVLNDLNQFWALKNCQRLKNGFWRLLVFLNCGSNCDFGRNCASVSYGLYSNARRLRDTFETCYQC